MHFASMRKADRGRQPLSFTAERVDLVSSCESAIITSWYVILTHVGAQCVKTMQHSDCTCTTKNGAAEGYDSSLHDFSVSRRLAVVIMAQAAAKDCPEVGVKSPSIVFRDAHIWRIVPTRTPRARFISCAIIPSVNIPLASFQLRLGHRRCI